VITEVNEAYKILKSDFERGNLLLKLYGQDSITEESQFGAEDQEFVVQMLEFSEVIFESEDPQELLEAKNQLLALRDKLKRTVDEQFSQTQFKELKPNLAKLNVLNKKLFALDERLAQHPDLEVGK
jgi:DnaJ-domain-containing protein 1